MAALFDEVFFDREPECATCFRALTPECLENDHCSNCGSFLGFEDDEEDETDLLCGDCSGYLTDEDIAQGYCSHCGTEMEPPLEDAEIIEEIIFEEGECPNCHVLLDFGEPRCDECELTIPDEYWRKLMGSIVDEREVPITDFDDEYNLCCDKHYEDCTCDVPLSFQDAQNEIDHASHQLAYKMGNVACTNCERFYGPSCEAYRTWIRAYYREGGLPGSIDDICWDYLAWYETPVTLSDPNECVTVGDLNEWQRAAEELYGPYQYY